MWSRYAPNQNAPQFNVTFIVQTRYVVLARRKAATGALCDPFHLSPALQQVGSAGQARTLKASVAVGLRNISGAIFKLTSCFAFRDMNIVKIESRPSAVANRAASGSVLTNRRHWDLIFYIDYEPSDIPAVNAALLVSLREYSLWVRDLGFYYSGLQQVDAAPAMWKDICDVVAY
jgi:prephenate dehydratase